VRPTELYAGQGIYHRNMQKKNCMAAHTTRVHTMMRAAYDCMRGLCGHSTGEDLRLRNVVDHRADRAVNRRMVWQSHVC
jgi:hypothetical protein